MFTGIIEDIGRIIKITEEQGNKTFTIKAEIASKLQIDQSVAHNGICLTVVACNSEEYKVTAIKETLELTSSQHWNIGDNLNLERAALLNTRLDGHLVQGHVDSIATIVDIKDDEGSWRFYFEFYDHFAPLVISKGSICIDGVSLTVIQPGINTFHVAIIPYTFEHTLFHTYKINDIVNLEFDIIGKYILRKEELKKST